MNPLGKVILNVHECKDLDVSPSSASSASFGKISPYIEVSCGSERYSTPEARHQGFHPKFTSASFIFNKIYPNDVIHIVVLANDLGSDPKLGWLDLPINLLLTSRGPTWYDLRTSNFANFKGKILIAGWLDDSQSNLGQGLNPAGILVGQKGQQAQCVTCGQQGCTCVGQKQGQSGFMGQQQGQCGCGKQGCTCGVGVGVGQQQGQLGMMGQQQGQLGMMGQQQGQDRRTVGQDQCGSGQCK